AGTRPIKTIGQLRQSSEFVLVEHRRHQFGTDFHLQPPPRSYILKQAATVSVKRTQLIWKLAASFGETKIVRSLSTYLPHRRPPPSPPSSERRRPGRRWSAAASKRWPRSAAHCARPWSDR